MKISTIILFKNNEEIIVNCLETIKWTDEIIGVDIGSTDKTGEIIKKYGGKVIKSKIKDDFSFWRNEGAKETKGEWLFYIDSDERCSLELKEEIKTKIKETKHCGFKIPRRNFFLGKEFKSAWPDDMIRLINKKKLRGWKGNIHETANIEGEIGIFTNPLIHLTHTSLEQMLEKTIWWSRLEAENRFKTGHPKMTSCRFIRIFLTGIWENFVKRRLYREGAEGVIEAIYQTFSLFFTYVRLWELQNKIENKYKKIEQQIK